MNETQLSPLLAQYALSPTPELMAQLVEGCLPLCRHIARRFSGQGVETEDLEQVAAIALMKAIERFEPDRGFRFVTYAVPTITGEVRNHLRDRSAMVRMPRDLRQRLYQLTRVQEAFEHEHLRAPTAAELAAAMRITPEEVLTILSMRSQTDYVSLDTPVGEDGDTRLEDMLGGGDAGYDAVERREWMKWILSKVNETEKELLLLRFRDGLGQRETAKRLGVSQMQISRLERRVLSRLRAIEQQS